MKDSLLSTLGKPLTEEEALDTIHDVIFHLNERQALLAFRQNYLIPRRSEILQLAARHLAGVPVSDLLMFEPEQWLYGSFNICIQILIAPKHHWRLPKAVLFRIAIPNQVGEDYRAGIVDEKTRCEAATYLWFQTHCPAIPIPRLIGMGFPDGFSFTAVQYESFWHQIRWHFRRSLAWLQGKSLARYFGHRRNAVPESGYLLVEFVREGRMLSSSWKKHRLDKPHRQNLFHGLARIMLRLAKTPLPRIGSWTMDNRGFISLSNRPFSGHAPLWSRGRIPSPMPRDITYTSAEAYIHDMLTYQDNRVRYQPNSIISKQDGVSQLSALAGLRALLPNFWDRESRDGPFVLNLPDHHQSNILVDNDWNITCLFDFEFAPVLPIQMCGVPQWFTSCAIDGFEGAELTEYLVLHDEFLTILEEEETTSQYDHTYSQILRDNMHTGRHWYNMAVQCFRSHEAVFQMHLQPKYHSKFDLDADAMPLARLWCENVEEFIAGKTKDMEDYEKRVHDWFVEAGQKDARERGMEIAKEDQPKAQPEEEVVSPPAMEGEGQSQAEDENGVCIRTPSIPD